ncbi:hypothetical protein ACFQ08_00610 [Streptosporangium algeriense]|uniref:Uncharacterized protein n=1 Tax=Streptosporangium algeriense TaxID=1682748 RepID=A0ABW3DJS9_9ACTN
MDTRHLFDTLARQEQPPLSIDVNQAVAAGRAIRRRRRMAAGAVSALSVLAVTTTTWLVLPQTGQRDGIIVSTPTIATPTATTPTAAPAQPSGARFKRMKKKYPPIEDITFVPEASVWMWLSWGPDPGGKRPILCGTFGGPDGVSCAGFPPLSGKEFARTQVAAAGPLSAKQVRALNPDATTAQLRELIQEQKRTNTLGKAFFGVARNEVHRLTAVAPDGNRVSGAVVRNAGAGLGVWAVKYPPGFTTATLTFTDANGKTLQRLPGD